MPGDLAVRAHSRDGRHYAAVGYGRTGKAALAFPSSVTCYGALRAAAIGLRRLADEADRLAEQRHWADISAAAEQARYVDAKEVR